MLFVPPPIFVRASAAQLAKTGVGESAKAAGSVREEIGQREWYNQGWWPIIGGISALIVTNAVSVTIVYVQSSKSFNMIVRQRKIEFLSESLQEFYSPLLALIDINGEIFSETGPKTFPLEEPSRSAAALVWHETKKKILQNNIEIENILRTKSHYLDESDSLTHYHSLLLHVSMYETFQSVETEIYKKFLFPHHVREHIFNTRTQVLEKLYIATGETI